MSVYLLKWGVVGKNAYKHLEMRYIWEPSGVTRGCREMRVHAPEYKGLSVDPMKQCESREISIYAP